MKRFLIIGLFAVSGSVFAQAQQLNPEQQAFIAQQNAAFKAEADAKLAAETTAKAAQEAQSVAAQMQMCAECDPKDVAAAQAQAQAASAAAQAAQAAVLPASQAASASMFMPGGLGAFAVTGRSNDPFTFCTKGVPYDGWVAVNGLTGTWTPIRQYPNMMWVPVFQRICPLVLSQGVWVGPGSGEAFAADPTGMSPVVPYTH